MFSRKRALYMFASAVWYFIKPPKRHDRKVHSYYGAAMFGESAYG